MWRGAECSSRAAGLVRNGGYHGIARHFGHRRYAAFIRHAGRNRPPESRATASTSRSISAAVL